MNARVTNLDAALRVRAGRALHEVTVGETAAALPAVADRTEGVFWTLDSGGGAIRVRFDGVNPTAATGHEIAAGSSGTWNADLWTRARVIRAGASDGKLKGTEVV